MHYYLKRAAFAVQEELTSFAHAIASFALYPFIAVVLALVWSRYAHESGSFSFAELLRYVGVTELIFMTSFRVVSGGWAQADFSLMLARPRSWLLTYFSAFLGCSTGKRIIYLGFFVGILGWVGGGQLHQILQAALRLVCLMPLLGVVEALYSLILCTLELVAPRSMYFRLVFSKFFLVCGGVIAPLSEVKGSVGEWFRASPFSDVIFQVGHFCVRGSFYQLSTGQWLMRILVHMLVLSIVVVALYSLSRRLHESHGS